MATILSHLIMPVPIQIIRLRAKIRAIHEMANKMLLRVLLGDFNNYYLYNYYFDNHYLYNLIEILISKILIRRLITILIIT